MTYILYVDESGDLGLDKVRDGIASRGASPFLTLGACLVPVSRREQTRLLLEDVRQAIGVSHLHCNELKHQQISYFARCVKNDAQVLLFGLVSRKATLGDYRDEIQGKDQHEKFYNKCMQLLLERVGNFLSDENINSADVSIVLERHSHDYQRLKNFIGQCRRTPIDSRTRFLERIDPLSIIDMPKESEQLLALADLCAFSLLRAVDANRGNYGVPEQRYFRELKKKFYAGGPQKLIFDYGLKMMKFSEMDLDSDTRTYFQGLMAQKQKS